MNFSISLVDIISVSPAILLFFGSLIPLTVKIMRQNREPNSLAALAYVTLAAVAAIGMAISLQPKSSPTYHFSNAIVIDGVSIFVTVLVCIITIVAAVMAREHNATNGRQFSEFLFLLMNSGVGMLLMAWSNDLIVTFIALEIMSLCLYLLVALSHEEKISKEAAFKYFVLGGFASALFLYGIAFLYGTTGTTYLTAIAVRGPQLAAESHLFLFGIMLAIVGLCFKVAIVPFHAWAPDVYEGAPTPVTAFMATGVKVVTFVTLLRVMKINFMAHDSSAAFSIILQWLAVFTMIAGNIAAVMQSNLKRMLAYSSIAHSGYVLVGVIASAVSGEGWRGDLGVIYYVTSYTIMTLGAFAVLCLLEAKENDMILVDDLKGLAKRNPMVAMIFAIFLLSLAGIPPTVGFFGKFFIFSAAIKQGFIWLAVWGAVSSIIGAYYYLRPIVYMYMREDGTAQVSEHYRITVGVTSLLAILTVLLGLLTEPVYQQVKMAISSFL
jgi:NADH-quinone oxidoreductase subunit N